VSAKRTMIAGGTISTESAVLAADSLIEGGRIAALLDPGSETAADERIDASGLVVIPGAIDMHAHFEDPGHTEREDFTEGAGAFKAFVPVSDPSYPNVTDAEFLDGMGEVEELGALWDLESEWQVDARSQQFSKNPWSPFDGGRARARVVRALVRGETVFAGGEILAEPGSGRFLSCHGDYALAPGSA
jgi:dihydroorotase-like cyclic amidohydrolase